MALKAHNRIQESNSDSMIDAHMNQSKPSPNAPTLVSPSHSDERETSQCTPDDNTQRTDIRNVCPGSYEPAQECLDDIEMKYHIDANVLGEGHHGSVRQCINRSTGKRHAVKSICKSAPSVNIRGIQREVSLLKSLKHDRILQLDEIYEDSEYVHLVTELCTGGELFDKIVEKSSTGRGCFSEDEAARRGGTRRRLQPGGSLRRSSGRDACTVPAAHWHCRLPCTRNRHLQPARRAVP